MRWFKTKYRITKDVDGFFWVYKKRFVFWSCAACAISYERAIEKLNDLKFIEYMD